MEIQVWTFVIGAIGLIITVIIAATKAATLILAKIESSRIETRDQIINVNNSMLASLKLAEARLEGIIDDVERDLNGFKFAATSDLFVSKRTFETIMQQQSLERREMRTEMLDRFNRIEDKLNGSKGASK